MINVCLFAHSPWANLWNPVANVRTLVLKSVVLKSSSDESSSG
jgi:hypothetical protein